jgi:hypothetical protein
MRRHAELADVERARSLRRSVFKGATIMNTTKQRRVALAVGTCGLLAAAGCAGATVTKTTAPTSAASVPAAAATSAPAPSAPATSAAPVTSGPIGTAFAVTTQDDNGNNVSYTVTAETVDQHAGLGPYETLDNDADHMAAVKFTITGVTGQVSDDADSDAVAIGTDTTEYQPSFNDVTDGGNFNSGSFAVAPGETVSGWVAFEVPPGKTIASVQWSPNSFESSHATWTVK